MLYTRKGDNGASGLFKTKRRFSKNHPVYDALGTLDELNSLLGVCRAHAMDVANDKIIQTELEKAQETLFIIQAELAGSDTQVRKEQIDVLEKTVDHIESSVGNPHAFVVPGATTTSAYLDFARTVARRAERCVIAAQRTRRMSDETYAYLNRLSSLLYALARYAAAKEGVREASPSYS